MSKKETRNREGIVYSTNPDYQYAKSSHETRVSIPPEEQDLKVYLDRKQRAGKTVTIIRGFIGKGEEIESLAKTIKTRCGTGGTVKDGEIIIQGDFREKVMQYLQSMGCKVKKAGG
jgi:translation initiation factor 1